MDSPPHAHSPPGPTVDTDMKPFGASGAGGKSPETPATSISSAFSPAPGTKSPGASEASGPSGWGPRGWGPRGWGPLSPDVADRVFPIRSVVNIEPRARPVSPSVASVASPRTESPQSGEDDVESGPASRRQSAARKPSTSGVPSSNLSDVSVRTTQGTSLAPPGCPQSVLSDDTYEDRGGAAADILKGEDSPEPEAGFVTARHKHIETEDGHMIVTGFDGVEQACEDEPIHIPGAVQGFGCLVALRETEEGEFDVRIASENTGDILGYTPAELFRMTSFCDVLSDEQAENLFDHVDFVREEASDPRQNGPEVFSLVITARDSTQTKIWCAIHVSERNADLLICEFELEDDQKYPLSTASEDPPNAAAADDTLGASPTEQELTESTVSMSKPLRVLRHARRRRGEAAAMEVFNLMSQIQEQLASAQTLDIFLKIVVGVVKELAGFHRVMIYQFDDAWNGQVVTELVDYRATKDLYKGLHFPASDIPVQARELYKLNKVRLLYDRDQTTARLVCKEKQDLENPLDLTHSYLRAMSPVHIKYLRNMQVRASMSISITAFDQLWGLISCHSYGEKGMRVSFPIRKMCRLIGETTSRNIERLSYAKRLHARKLINTVPTEANPGGYIVASSDDLLRLFDADFGLLSIRDETKVLGKLENSQEALAMLEYLRIRNFTTVITSQDLRKDFPDLKYAPGFSVVAGLLLVPLSLKGTDFIVFFRKGQLRHVHWAGNPYEKNMKKGTASFLEPRTSFKIWSETVVGKSREWTEEQVETAAVLCLVYGKFIEVWRQKEAALKTSQLTRLLLANASHEVRTPLNAIINCLEIALEGPLDTETRDNLARSHSASKSLIYVINDLLDLTRTEGGRDLVKDEEFDFHDTVAGATGMFRADAQRKDITFEIKEYPGLPERVKGDPSRLRQILSNITGNAVQHTDKGGVLIEVYATSCYDTHCDIEIAVQDTGTGMSPQKLDALFREFEQVHSEDDEDPDADGDGASFNALSKIPGQKTLGLGLAIVARTVRNMKGQLRLKSEEGKGSRFTVCIPLTTVGNKKAEGAESPQTNVDGMTPPPPAGEVTLVDSTRSLQSRPSMHDMRRNSGGSMKSNFSGSSGTSRKSEIDRLVDAISSPHIMPDAKGIPPRPNSTDGVPPNPESLTRATTLPTASSNPTPGLISRSTSAGAAVSTARAVSAFTSTGPGPPPGEQYIESEGTPMKSIRVPAGAVQPDPASLSITEGEEPKQPAAAIEAVGHGSSPTTKAKQHKPTTRSSPSEKSRPPPPPQNGESFNVLVAEDDPINSKIMAKRLERMGHTVKLTVNGNECLEVFKELGSDYDCILMDMQMPIMDGGTSTTRIREHESKDDTHKVPEKHLSNGRIPIFAVSASLVETRKEEYVATGFDGWILKPVDFKRLDNLLRGIRDRKLRSEAAYEQGQWERGGWFDGEMPGQLPDEPPEESADAAPGADTTAAAVATEGDYPGDV